MAYEPDYPAKAGCFSRLISLFVFVLLIGAGVCIYLAAQPQDLTALKRAAADSAPASKREMKDVLKNAVDRGYPVPLSEAQINAWLSRTVSGRQTGAPQLKASFKNVWVKLEDGLAEIIMERDVMGYALTTSMFLQIEKRESAEGMRTEIMLDGGAFHPSFPKPPRGGRIGQLVVPQGFLLLTMPAYEKLATLLTTEIDLGFREMSAIKFEKGKLTLDPRPAADLGPLLPH